MSGRSAREDKALSTGRGGACKGPGLVVPVVDRARCEGKRDCVDACPHDVFEVRRIDDRDFAALGSDCLSCHRKDDVHDGSFGARCEQCHVTDNWKKVSNRVLRGSATPDAETTATQVAALLGRASRFARSAERPGSNGWLQ